jgi:hypothetical protein
MYKIALITEEFDGEVVSFPNEQSMKAYADGFADAGSHYAAGHCRAYTLEEAEKELEGEERDEVVKALKED